MNDGLIDEDFEQRQPLNFKSGSSGLLTVNWPKWSEKLISVERRNRVGCLGMFILGMGGLYLPFLGDGRVLMPLSFLLLGIIYIFVHARRHKNLLEHGRYRYEIYPTKVVRFSDRDFSVVEYQDLTKVSVKPYGTLLVRKQRLSNLWLSHRNPAIMVLPASMKSYAAAETYLVGQYTRVQRSIDL